MTKIERDVNGTWLSDTIHTKFEPSARPGLFLVYKGHRAYPMATVFANADARLVDIYDVVAA